MGHTHQKNTDQENKNHARPAGGTSETAPTFQLKADPIQRASSASLGGDVMTKMENTIGHDFSGVNIHTESQQATDVGALAYTQGKDVHFAPGQFKPETKEGQELIGHEFTHVKQQDEGRVKPTTEVAGMPVNDDKGLEAEADSLGSKAANSSLA